MASHPGPLHPPLDSFGSGAGGGLTWRWLTLAVTPPNRDDRTQLLKAKIPRCLIVSLKFSFLIFGVSCGHGLPAVLKVAST